MYSCSSVLRLATGVLVAVALAGCPEQKVSVTLETPTIFPLPDAVNTNPLRIFGGKPAGTQVIVLVDGQDALTKAGDIDDTTSWSFELPLRDGRNRFALVARDAADNLSEPSAPVDVELDTEAPPAPVVDDPVGGVSCTNLCAFRVVIPLGQTEVTLTLRGTKAAGASLHVNDDAVLPATDTATTWEHPVTLTADGASLRLSSRDVAGNESAVIDLSITAGGDIDPPAPPTVDGLPADLRLAAGEASRLVTVTGTKDADTSVHLGETQLVVWDAETTWTASVEIRPGENRLSFVAKDGAGNVSEAQAASCYGIAFMPAPTLDTAPVATNASPVTVGGTKPVDLVATGVALRQQGSTTWAPLATIDNSADWTAELAVTRTLTFFLAATNERGDVGEEAGPFTIAYDVTPPTPPTVDPIPLVLVSSGSTATIDVAGDKDADATVIVERLPVGSGALVTAEQDPADATRWTATVTAPLGDSSWHFTAVDRAGNVSSPVEESVTARIGLAPPSVSLPDRSVNTTTVTLGGARPRGVSVYFRREADAEGTLAFRGGDAAQPTVVSTVYSFEFALSEEGANRFFLYTEDTGRRSVEIGPLTITRDTIAPAPPLIVPPPAQVDLPQLTISGTKAEVRNQVCVKSNGEPSCRTVAASSAPLNFEIVETLRDGENSLCFRSIDEAGNVSIDRCVLTELGAAPQLTIKSPNQGQVVSTADVEIVVEAFGSTTSPIATVEACLSAVCDEGVLNADPATGLYTIAVTLPRVAETTRFALEITATNDAGRFTSDVLEVLYFVKPLEVYSNPVARVRQLSDKVKVAVDDVGTIHIVWIDNCFDGPNASDCSVPFINDGSPPIGKQLFYARSDGASFDDVVNLSDLPGSANADQPAIAIDAFGDVHVVWVDQGTIGRESGSTDLDLIHRVVSGIDGTAGPPRLLTVDAALPVNDNAPSLATDALGRVHLAYVSTNQNLQAIVQYRMYDEAIWGSAVQLTDRVDVSVANAGAPPSPSIAIDTVSVDAVPFVAWREKASSATPGDVKLRAVGEQLGAVVNISNDDADSTEPDITVDAAGFVHVVWRDNPLGDAPLHYRNYEPLAGAGSPLSPTFDVSAGGSGAQGAAVAVNNDTGAVLAVWGERPCGGTLSASCTSADPQLTIYRSVFDGTAFTTPTPLLGAALSSKYANDAKVRVRSPLDVAIVSGQNAYYVWAITDLRNTGSTDDDDDVWMTIQAAP